VTLIVQNCGAFSIKNRSLHHIEYMVTNSGNKTLQEDQHPNILLRSSTSNGAEELMVISYADHFTPLFLLTL